MSLQPVDIFSPKVSHQDRYCASEVYMQWEAECPWHRVARRGKEFLVTLQNQHSPWKLMVGSWKTTFLLGRPIFQGYVSFREGMWSKSYDGSSYGNLRSHHLFPSIGQPCQVILNWKQQPLALSLSWSCFVGGHAVLFLWLAMWFDFVAKADVVELRLSKHPKPFATVKITIPWISVFSTFQLQDGVLGISESEAFLEDFLFRGAGSADAHLSHNLLLRRDAQGLEGR